MYCEHFGLKLPPFNNTPDPRFFFNSPDHEEALASLLYAVEERKGFVLVTGEVGAGKTLLSRLLLNRLHANVRTAVITNTRLNGPELLEAICREFEIETAEAESSAELTHKLEEFLLEQYARDRLAVVVIDEAQNLPLEALEELRMLGNLEADDAKLLQVLLLGQPELQEAFRHPSLRQTFQRVFRTFHLRALNEPLTAGYIYHRLSIAGAAIKEPLFSRKGIEAVYRHSEGIPRLINQICDNALLAGFSAGSGKITEELVDEVVQQMMSLDALRDRPKPHGAFARQALGVPEEPHVAPAARAESEAPKPMSATVGALGAPAMPSVSKEAVANLTQRLQQLEASLTRIESSSSSKESPKPGEISDARRALDQIKAETRSSQSQLDELLKRAETSAQAIEGRAAQAVTQAEKNRADIEARTAAMLDEFTNLSKNQKDRVEDILREGRDELDAVRELRRQASEIHQTALRQQQESERRVSKAIADAADLSKRLEGQTRDFLSSAKDQSGELIDKLQTLFAEMQQKSEASQQRMIEMLSQQRSDFEKAQITLDDATRKATARSNDVAKHSDEIISGLKTEAAEVITTIHGVRNRTVARSEQACQNADAFVTEMSAKMGKAHQNLIALANDAEAKVASATKALADVQNTLLADAEKGRRQADGINQQTRDILDETRRTCEALLGKLREEVAEQSRLAEKAWNETKERGTQTLGDVRSELESARTLTEKTRAELEAVVNRSHDELSKARAALEEDIETNRGAVAKLSQDALAVKLDFEQRFKSARAKLDQLLGDHDASVTERIESLRGHLTTTESEAERILDELKQALDRADTQSTDCRNRLEEVAANLRDESEAMIEKQRQAVAASQSQLEKLTETADSTTGRFQNELRQINESARSRMTAIGKELAEVLAKAIARADDVRKKTESESAQLAARLDKTRTEASDNVEKAEDAIRRIRMQSKSSLEEVRQCLTQMTERADAVRREIGSVGDEVKHISKETTDKLVKTGDRITMQVESLRKNAQDEADANVKRLTAVRQQVEQSAEQMRENASKLLDQVQAGTAALRRHAEDMLTQAQNGADKLNQSASTMMIQAQTSSERFREQAETLLHNAETMAEEIRGEVNELRAEVAEEADRAREDINASAEKMMTQAQGASDRFREQSEALLKNAGKMAEDIRGDIGALRNQVNEEAESVRSQITDARGEILNAREETAAVYEAADRARRESEKRAAEILKAAKDTQLKAENLLALPQQLVEEARQQATALSEMSRKVASIVKNLTEAGNKAEGNKKALDLARQEADDKLTTLKRHTERVGQLVGIIRQLYGTMDAKMDRLRGRLSQVDDLFRTVPQELNGIRAMLDDDDLSERRAQAAATPPADDRMHRAAPAPTKSGATAGVANTQPTGGRRDLPNLLSDDNDDQGGNTYRAEPNASGGATITVTKPQQKQTYQQRQSVVDPAAAKAAREEVRKTIQAGSLGDVVRRNQKLNQWLKDVLGEEGVDGPNEGGDER